MDYEWDMDYFITSYKILLEHKSPKRWMVISVLFKFGNLVLFISSVGNFGCM